MARTIPGVKGPNTRPTGRTPFSFGSDLVSPRTTLAENPSMSKAIRHYGVDGAKGDFPHSSTGGDEAHESAIAPSMPATHRGGPAVPHVETVGHAPDGSGNFHHATHPNAERQLHGNAHFNTEPLKPAGQAWSATAGSGKQSKVPAKQAPKTHTADAGALAGDSHARHSYSGGRGPIGGK